ncbi:MAG: hypothetical protein NVSMB9_12120 [Isosphaeraceae bacterium]
MISAKRSESMRNHGVLLGLLSAGVVFISIERPVRADFNQTTQTYSIPLTPTDFNPGTPSLLGKDPFQVQLFDPTKFGDMTLVGVGINLHYQFENTLSMRFDNPSTITVNASGSLHLYGPDGKTDLVNSPGFANTATEVATPADMYAKYFTEPTKVITSDSGQGYTDAATLAAFTGPGTISLPIYATANSGFTSTSGNGLGSSDTSASATLTVVYFFAAVPEPSSLVLMSLGGLALGVAGWNRLRLNARNREQDAPLS